MSAPAVGSGDRFGVTLLFSLIAHGVLALGLTFEYEKPAQSLPALDVILVQSATGTKPRSAFTSSGVMADIARLIVGCDTP